MKVRTTDIVKVRLTPRGKELVESRAGTERGAIHIQEDAEGWSRWRLWFLFWVFGEDIMNGETPFHADMEIEEGAK